MAEIITNPQFDGIIPTFCVTNDFGLDMTFSALMEFNASLPTGDTDCAVIVGSGGLLSGEGVYPRNVYVTDKDPDIHNWVDFTINKVLSSDSPEECCTAVLKAVLASDLPAVSPYPSYDPVEAVDLAMIAEGAVLGDIHFLDSQERYEQCRNWLQGVNIAYINMDYGVRDDTDQLIETINSADQRVRLFNPTNIHAHLKGRPQRLEAYLSGIASLPFAERYRIIASGPIRLTPTRSAPPFTSFEDYVKHVNMSVNDEVN